MDKYTLKTAFEKSFLGLVWRIETDVANGLLAVETRNKDTGAPLFSVFRYTTGISLIHEMPYGDRYWTLAAIVDNKLILRAYGQNSPDSAGIACIDALSGDVQWEQFNYAFLAIQDEAIIVRHRNFADGHEQYLAIHHGNLTQKTEALNKPMRQNIVIPQRHDGYIPAFLENYDIYGDLFHCTAGQNNVYAFHERDDQLYRIRLVVSSDSGVLADKVVISGLAKMIPELFFMINKQIFLIGNNKRKIVSYLV
ncbi:DUF4905 domain-containing protein [Parapedobacter tibetensis]|uniref:DUF4905 domain-containing protein n=1 Tax=Parapedobacter tibetensis TaxID=2972951 RepID=UPI00214DC7AD|nr:DUF4905 domain-containing protein [Parapedobacter tibetensis]